MLVNYLYFLITFKPSEIEGCSKGDKGDNKTGGGQMDPGGPPGNPTSVPQPGENPNLTDNRGSKPPPNPGSIPPPNIGPGGNFDCVQALKGHWIGTQKYKYKTMQCVATFSYIDMQPRPDLDIVEKNLYAFVVYYNGSCMCGSTTCGFNAFNHPLNNHYVENALRMCNPKEKTFFNDVKRKSGCSGKIQIGTPLRIAITCVLSGGDQGSGTWTKVA